MRPICRSIQVVIPVAAGAGSAGAKLKFPDTPELRESGVQIYGVQSCDVTTVSNTLDGVAVVTAADALKVLVTLVEKSNQRFQLIPYRLFDQIATSGIWFEATPFVIAMQQCFVNFTIAAVAATPFSLPFIFHFLKPGDPGYQAIR